MIPDLREVPLKLVSTDSVEFMTSDFISYEFVVDHWSAAVQIKAETPWGGAPATVWFAIGRPDLLLAAVEKLLKELSPGSPEPTSETATPDTDPQL